MEMLVGKLMLTKEIKDYTGLSLKDSYDMCNSIEAKTLDINDPRNKDTLSHLKKMNMVSLPEFISYDDEIEAMVVEQEKDDKLYEEAKAWMDNLSKRKKEYVERLMMACVPRG